MGTGEATNRQQEVAKLWFKGFTNDEIAKMLGVPKRRVSDDLKIIRLQLRPTTIYTIEYYRNKSRRRLDMIRKRAWEIVETDLIREGARVAALRLVKEVEDLQTKVDGIVTDKMLVGPEKKVEELHRRLIEIASPKEKGNGHDEKEDEVVSDALTETGAEETNP